MWRKNLLLLFSEGYVLGDIFWHKWWVVFGLTEKIAKLQIYAESWIKVRFITSINNWRFLISGILVQVNLQTANIYTKTASVVPPEDERLTP
jgi:hypothetical protein